MGPARFDPISYLEANAARRPGAPAVLDSGRTITFQQLEAHVHAAASRLRLEPGQVVGVRLPNVWEYVALELAIPLAGGVVMPLPLTLGEAELTWARDRSGTVRVLGGADLAGLLAEPRPDERVPHPRPDPDAVVEIALTSGTTGLPKLASLDAGLKQATFEGFTSRLEVTEDDRVLVMSPLTQGIGGMCLYCLRLGAALVMLRQPRFTSEQTLAVAATSAATLLVGVPTNVIRLLQSPALASAALGRLRATAVAGAPMPPAVAREWEERTGAPVCIFYGSMDAGQLAVGSPSDPQDKRWTSVGRPHDVAELKITDEGEICMRGPTVQRRYWGEDRGPFSEDGWAHMGDLGFLDSDGFLHVSGRLKDTIIRGGTNINPYEVEDAIRSHPDVADVCVVGRPDRELGERAVAFLVARRPLEVGDLQAHLDGRGVAKYKWPEFVGLVDEIPLSGPGKVDRRALKEKAREVNLP